MMKQTAFYAKKMQTKSIDDLKKYVFNQEHYHEDAILAAVKELQNRSIYVEGMEKIQELLSKENAVKRVENDNIDNIADLAYPALYGTKFIYIFSVLFSVFGGGILMAMNFLSLKNKKAAINTITLSLGYAILISLLIEVLKINNLIVSILANLAGVYLLYYFIWDREVSENLKFQERDIWKPILIGLAVAFPVAYLMLKSGNM